MLSVDGSSCLLGTNLRQSQDGKGLYHEKSARLVRIDKFRTVEDKKAKARANSAYINGA